MEKENNFCRGEGKYIFCGGEETRKRKRGKIFGEGKFVICGGEEERRGKMKKI